MPIDLPSRRRAADSAAPLLWRRSWLPMSAIWAIVYLRRRSAIAPMVSHAGFDALEILRAALFP